MSKPKRHPSQPASARQRRASRHPLSADQPPESPQRHAMPHILAIADALYPVREAVQAYAALAHLLMNQPHDHNDTPEAAELGRLLGLMNEGLAQRVALACAQAEAAQGALG